MHMKKKLLYISAAALAMLAFAACNNKQEEDVTEAVLEVVKSDIVLPASGGTGSIEFTATEAVKVSVDRTWCTVSVSGNTVTVSATENVSLQSRYALVTLTAGDEKQNVTVHQYGYIGASFSQGDITTDYKAKTIEIEYEYDELLSATTDVDWMTVEVTDALLKLTLTQNSTGVERTGNVSWTLGANSGSFSVEQDYEVIMQEDANWNVYYNGRVTYNGTEYDSIYNEVTDPTVSGKYMLTYVSVEDFEASGLSQEDYLLSVAGPECKDYMDYVIGYYASYGYSLSYDDFLYEDSDYDIFEFFEPGNYYAYAIGFNEKGKMTGHYAYSEFQVKSSLDYDNYLGMWEATSSNGATEIWTIEEDVYGETYKVSNVNGYSKYGSLDLSIIAQYDGGNFVIKAQTGRGTYTNSSNFEVTFSMLGVYVKGTSKYRVTPSSWENPYTIATGTLNDDGDQIPLTPGAAANSESGAYEGMQWYGLYTKADGSAGAYYYNSNVYTVLPNTLKKVVPEDNYSKWLGSWNITRGDQTDTWTITAKEQGATYNVEGIEGHAYDFFSAYVEGTYNEDGTFTISEQEVGSPYASSSGETITPKLIARFEYTDGKTYIWNETDPIFTGTLSEDGKSASLVGESLIYNGSNYGSANGFAFYGLVNGSAKYWWCGGVVQTLPATLAQVTTSSVKKASVNAHETTFRMERADAPAVRKSGASLKSGVSADIAVRDDGIQLPARRALRPRK